MLLWPHEEKIIFLDLSRFGMQIESGQNTVSVVVPFLSDISSAMRGVG